MDSVMPRSLEALFRTALFFTCAYVAGQVAAIFAIALLAILAGGASR